ncbi:deazaflavin-dependent oxidoreductase (nitroreductase family) [Promicromonospora sp. AC04]|uniref:nitroreductase/quinone reductase family protein n=1 Tax=Promicromonospora sp. AC04 TaxID=2135723 RepID=UPI000D3F7D2B|nr:nitroreductase/quinone reductase family protein [Promicromonospora sp. AC04]PUB27663.1 deazaflavin-dependent oxidoreductase (nitroreductase family) [Promicromonospora sp. AC04]
MSFNTPNGTYGAQMPVSTAQMRAMNERNIAAIRAGQSAMGMQALVLITIGKKSGQVRENPVAYFPVSNDSWLVVASAAGAAKHPAWYFNLAAQPDKARVVLAGEEFDVDAEELHGQEREHVWRQIASASAGFAQYETLTDRVIPVIRLTRRTH